MQREYAPALADTPVLYMANLAALHLLVDRAGLGEILAQLLVLPLYVITAFMVLTALSLVARQPRNFVPFF